MLEFEESTVSYITSRVDNILSLKNNIRVLNEDALMDTVGRLEMLTDENW